MNRYFKSNTVKSNTELVDRKILKPEYGILEIFTLSTLYLVVPPRSPVYFQGPVRY